MKLIGAISYEPDLRDDKQFFIDHPGAVPISTAQVKTITSYVLTDCSIVLPFRFISTNSVLFCF